MRHEKRRKGWFRITTFAGDDILVMPICRSLLTYKHMLHRFDVIHSFCSAKHVVHLAPDMAKLDST